MYLARNQWSPSWLGENSALQIGRIQIWQRGDGTEELQTEFAENVQPFLDQFSTKVHPMFNKN